MSRLAIFAALGLCSLALTACNQQQASVPQPADAATAAVATSAPASANSSQDAYVDKQLGKYAEVTLNADLSGLDAQQKKMLGVLIQAADVMNGLYWQQSWGDRDSLMAQISDAETRRFVDINFGPWDRLNNDHPFVAGIGLRPAGARFYPEDMSKAEFEAADLKDKASLYTVLRRDETGKLTTIPYHQLWRGQLEKAAGLLQDASKLAQDKGFANFLSLRAEALLSDNYQASDMAWMNMKTNPIDIVIGPIETYEDQLFGYKTAYESYVLIKDMAWSKRLARFARYLPELQHELPVAEKYRAEKPGSDADLNAYFAVYYAGDANVGAKTIAINLPNDETVQLEKGTRRLQLENVMQAKFDQIMVPIGHELIAEDQQKNLTFDAFFQNTMFHEVAHGLGIKNTLDGKGTVRKALKDQASSFEEGKADVLGLFMVTKLADKGELDKAKLMDNYVTFLTGILRSVRFGASDAHATANMVRFNFFKQMGAFSRDDASGRYSVDFDKMTKAMAALSKKLLTVQGDGDYVEAKHMTDTLGKVGPQLAADLKRLDAADIPVDITFKQGADVLGFKPEVVQSL